MKKEIHFIISKWRNRWAVNADADRLSDHPNVEKARREASLLANQARRDGVPASTLDLTVSSTDIGEKACGEEERKSGKPAAK